MKTFHCVYDILRLITDRVTFDEFYAPLYINKHATVEHVDDYTTIIIMYTYNSYVYVSDYAAFFLFCRQTNHEKIRSFDCVYKRI